MNELLMPFIDESENFVNGFECGQIWQQMSLGLEIDNRPVHNNNLKQIEMIANNHGYEITFENANDDFWHYLSAKPVNIDSAYKTELPNKILRQFRDYVEKNAAKGLPENIKELMLKCIIIGYKAR